MIRKYLLLGASLALFSSSVHAQKTATDIEFVRQGVKRIIFDEQQRIPLAELNPKTVVGLSAMHPAIHSDTTHPAKLSIDQGKLQVSSSASRASWLWLSGFNPFATYSLDLDTVNGPAAVGFEFRSPVADQGMRITVHSEEGVLKDIRYQVWGTEAPAKGSMKVENFDRQPMKGVLLVQLLGSGLVVYLQQDDLPQVIGQLDFNHWIDLREKERIQKFQTWVYFQTHQSHISVNKAAVDLTTGTGLADIRAITYEDGTPLLDQGRLWYTMTMRGRALPHHLQGVFSMDPTAFDIRFEGAIVFDRQDGLLRNEVASHLFYDRLDSVWRGVTTGFSAYADLENEEKELLVIESKQDPRFGFSIMNAREMGQVGDIEDAHMLYDSQAGKWRMLTCENRDAGYKAVMLESDHWDHGYRQIAGPVAHNSTGTSIQRIAGKLYCFSGSDQRDIFIYSYPDLTELGTLNMDLPPWDETSNTRVWPNVVEMPEGYPARYLALMMDRFNFPGIQGNNWTYGALYLYYGY